MNPTPETMGLVKGALAKTVTTATGLVTYDLQAPAKNLYPIITPLRNSIPRKTRITGPNGAGTATHWKVVSALNGSGFNAMGWVPEGQRSGRMNYTTEDKAATYVTLGEEDALTFEAESAAVGFEDENAMVTFRLLQKMMSKEEIGILAGNRSVALGTPGTVAKSAAGSGSALDGTYYINVVALTLEGWMNSSVSGGVATNMTITGADGQTFVLNGGSSNKSAQVSQAVSTGQVLSASVPAVEGAVAYAWYVGLATTNYLQQITTINSATFTSVVTDTQPITEISGDHSRNTSYAFDGLLTTAFDNSDTAYVQYMATGTAGTGTPMTASGRGTVEEIDAMLLAMWNNWRTSPTVIYVSAQQLQDITTLVLSGGSNAPLLRVTMPGSGGDAYRLTAGGMIEIYFNPYTNTKIPVKVHPNLPAGTLLAWCEVLPPWYQSNEVPNVAEILTRRDYYRIDWPLVTRMRQYGVYAEEVLAVYAPFAMGVITNIAPL